MLLLSVHVYVNLYTLLKVLYVITGLSTLIILILNVDVNTSLKLKASNNVDTVSLVLGNTCIVELSSILYWYIVGINA